MSLNFRATIQQYPLLGCFQLQKRRTGYENDHYSGQYFAVLTLTLAIAVVAFAADDAPRMEVEKLRIMLNNPSLSVLDVRIASDWRKRNRKTPCAVRVDPHDVSSWIGNSPKKTFW